MRLKSIEFSENDGQPNEWRLEKCTFGDKNLIVGENAAGKSRTLNVICSLAQLLSGGYNHNHQLKSNDNYSVTFEDDNGEIEYVIKVKDSKVIQEKLTINGKNRLHRREDGTGTIFAKELKQDIKFQPPANQLAVVTRRDTIQHPFLEILYDWGKSVVHFQFGTPMGQNQGATFISGTEEQDINFSNPAQVVLAFKKGEKKHGATYVQQIIEDMQKLGYEIEEISLQPFGMSKANGETIYLIQVKEKGLVALMQNQLSTGMFRLLSLLVRLNLLILEQASGCVIIDDIGEGLDYSRSTALIKLLLSKVEGTNIQLIMATNDRYVMNVVPLEYWSVIDRTANSVKIYDYRNSQEIFEEFEFTGLNNFDFFSSNYIHAQN